MYKSPIDIIYGQMQTQIEGDIFRAVQSYCPNVDKEELIRALQFDRNQYEKGYADGKAGAMAELVRCKDCYNCTKSMWCNLMMMNVGGDWYCSHGKRKEA